MAVVAVKQTMLLVALEETEHFQVVVVVVVPLG